MNREPALIVGAVGAVVNAALVVAFAFVAGVTPEQREAVFGLAAALVALVGVVAGVVTRAHVSPVGDDAPPRDRDGRGSP